MFTITATTNLKRRLGEGAHMPRTKVQRILSTLPDRMLKPSSTGPAEQRPDETIQQLQKQHTHTDVETPAYSDLQDFFHAPTKAEIDAYQHDILAAVRGSKVDTLREYHASGRPMKCSNEYGESILHLSCRKGLTDVARFLVEEAKVPVQVCDDYGRNPLHDACWVHQPNFELMDLILTKCPDLLFIKDRRGHTPLSFARRDQWKAWNEYLNSKKPEFLAPKELLKRQKESSSSSATNTTPATTASPAVPNKVISKRPTVAATGIKIPTITANVAAQGIKIPIANSAINLAMSGINPAGFSKPLSSSNNNNTSKLPVLKPLVPLVKLPVVKAGMAKSAINVLLEASKVQPAPATAALMDPPQPAATAG